MEQKSPTLWLPPKSRRVFSEPFLAGQVLLSAAHYSERGSVWGQASLVTFSVADRIQSPLLQTVCLDSDGPLPLHLRSFKLAHAFSTYCKPKSY